MLLYSCASGRHGSWISERLPLKFLANTHLCPESVFQSIRNLFMPWEQFFKVFVKIKSPKAIKEGWGGGTSGQVPENSPVQSQTRICK